MSLSVLGGYRVKIESASELFGFVNRVKAAIAPSVEALIANHLAEKVAEVRDSASLNRTIALDAKQQAPCGYGGREESPLLLAVAALDAAHRHVRTKQMRDVDRDFSFTVSFQIAENGFVLANVVSERRELIAIWEAHPEVSDFAIDTHCEKPDSISDEEWALRVKLWAAWEGNLTFDFPVTLLPIPSKEIVFASIPTIEQRALRFAKRDAAEHYCNRMRRSLGEEFWQVRYMDVLMRMPAFAKTHAYARLLARLTESIAAQLVPLETPDDLMAFA